MQVVQLIGTWVCAAALVVLVVLRLVPPPETAKAATPTFDFSPVALEDSTLESDLDALGAAGWQIATCRRATTGSESNARGLYECIMQRERAVQAEVAARLPPACAQYSRVYRRCVDEMPLAARGPALDGLGQLELSWAKGPREPMEAACELAYDAAKDAMSAACPEVVW